MIARMKKVTLLVSAKLRQDFLAKLRKAGVLHIKHVNPPSSDEITKVEDKIALLNNALNVLVLYGHPSKKEERPSGGEDAVRLAEEIIKTHNQREDALRSLREARGQMDWFHPWGGFNLEDLEVLKKEGIAIKLYRLNKDEFGKIKDEHKDKVSIIKREKGYVYIAFVSHGTQEGLGFDELDYPQRSHDELKRDITRLSEVTKEADIFFSRAVLSKEAIKDQIAHLERRLNFLNVRFGMKDEEAFSYLEGFCPEDDLGRVVSLAESEKAACLAQDPDDPEETPTLIKNPAWIDIISPVFKFMNTLPGYREFDISLPFLIFFSLFFAMLIGDAGYGILFLIITYLARRKAKNVSPQPFYLMYLLGVATIIWGAVTGTWFGSERIGQLPLFKNVAIGRINIFSADNQDFMIYLCFLIGAVHLSLAHLIQGARVINSFSSLAHVGWTSVIWGLFFTAGTLVIGSPFPPFAGYLIAIGAGLILFFSNPQRNILRGVLLTLVDLPLKIISSFSDLVSYIRLFAVGYASVIVAKSFNDIALTAGFGSIAGSLGTALILFFGHALNIVLGLMAVIVHGIRLNMLEFSGHMGMQWSGREYKPFKED